MQCWSVRRISLRRAGRVPMMVLGWHAESSEQSSGQAWLSCLGPRIGSSASEMRVCHVHFCVFGHFNCRGLLLGGSLVPQDACQVCVVGRFASKRSDTGNPFGGDRTSLMIETLTLKPHRQPRDFVSGSGITSEVDRWPMGPVVTGARDFTSARGKIRETPYGAVERNLTVSP
jgi:hypothetical protein